MYTTYVHKYLLHEKDKYKLHFLAKLIQSGCQKFPSQDIGKDTERSPIVGIKV